MDTGIVISYIIGGLLLMAILFMNMNLGQSSTELTLHQITQQNIKNTSEVISHDFDKIGYDRLGKISNAISVADSNRIVFQANINTTSSSVETVEWYFDPNSTVSSSTNPDAHTLKRIVDGDITNINLGITSFKITYLDSVFNEIPTPITSQSNRNDIRHIKVEMTISSKEAMGTINGGSKYIRSPLEKTFTPKNLDI